MITLEDIIEELFGEIEDEHDVVEKIAIKNQDGSFTFSARLEIDEINNDFDITLQRQNHMKLWVVILYIILLKFLLKVKKF